MLSSVHFWHYIPTTMRTPHSSELHSHEFHGRRKRKNSKIVRHTQIKKIKLYVRSTIKPHPLKKKKRDKHLGDVPNHFE